MHIQIPVIGGTLHAEITGNGNNGNPVILWHGLMCATWVWSDLASTLSQKYQVINLEMRGHGLSTIEDGVFDMDTLARDIISLMDYMKIEKANIVAHSMGGVATLHSLINNPERIKSAVIVSSNGNQDNLLLLLKYKLLVELSTKVSFSYLIPIVTKILLGKTTLEKRPEIVSFLKEKLLAVNPKAVYACGKALFSRPYLLEKLKQTQPIPTLVLEGDEEYVFPSPASIALSSCLPNSRYALAKNTGHMLPIENPFFLAKEVLNFIDSVSNTN